jgi:hypothetical protein
MVDEFNEVDPNYSRMMPKLNRWAGWFGREASPGEVLTAFVGDRLGSDVDDHWPALFWGRTGGYLIRSIGLENWKLCYYTNSTKPPWADSDLRKEMEHVLPDRIVALGRSSSEILKLHGIDAVTLSHPSWVLRFHYSDREEYGKLYRREVRHEGHQPGDSQVLR